MATLTKDQLDFLELNRISASLVFDATGLERAKYSEIMRAEEKLIAIGVTPCKAAGHTMRESQGHCVQCSGTTLAFLRRHRSAGQIYVAASPKIRKVKVGYSADARKRMRTINGHEYGGASDWILVAVADSKRAGELEFLLHKELAKFRFEASYIANGRVTPCREIFSCGYPEVRGAMRSVMTDEEATSLKALREAKSRFDFSGK